MTNKNHRRVSMHPATRLMNPATFFYEASFLKLTFLFFTLIIACLILAILSVNFSYAQFNGPSGGAGFSGPQGGGFSGGNGGSFVSSNPQYYQSGFQGPTSDYSYYGIYANGYQDYQEICRERQDFIVQIAPAGCSPVVVRSDLLSEQNVPVFCKLQAIQINPAVQAEYIKNIGFTSRGALPKEVAGVSYYRPRALLSPRINTQGFPTLDNIGYAVIILKRNPNENNMSDFVSGNLTARITYDVPNGFGAGVNELIIPPLNDEKWNSDYTKYGFFDGKGFVRVERVEGNFADVSVYRDKEHKISSYRLEKGKSSSELYLPGFYCNAAYRLNLVDVVPANTQATINIDGDSYDVYKGMVFANGLCNVRDVKSSGYGYGSVSLKCNGKPFNLELSYRGSNFEIDGTRGSYNIGDVLDSIKVTENGKEIEKKVYLVNINNIEDKNIAILLLTDKPFDENLKSSLNDYMNKKGSTIEGVEILSLSENEEGSFSGGKKIKFVGFGGTEDIDSGDSEFETSFLSAIDSYETVDDDYNGTISKEDGVSIGKKSLVNAIKLSSGKNKDKTLLDLSNKLSERYDSISSVQTANLNFDNSKASYILDSGNSIRVITLTDISEPSFDEKGVEVLVDNVDRRLSNNGEFIIPKNSSGFYIQMKSFDEDGINIDAKCIFGDKTESISGENGRINFRSQKVICGKNIFVKEIHLQRNAKIKLEPINRNIGSEVNVSYNIGIEKRAIQLSPQKTSERIKRLNQSINEWQNISNSLGKVVKGMKAACFATSATLQVKNLFSNLGGKAIARTEVMRTSGGWNDLCAEAIANGGVSSNPDMASGPYNSLDDCFRKNNDLIEKDVSLVSTKIESVNSQISKLELDGGFVKKGDGVFGGKSIDYNGARNKYFETLKGDLSEKNIVANNGKEGSEKEEVKFNDVFSSALKSDSVSYEQLREIKLYSDLANDPQASSSVKEIANKKLYDDLNQVNKLKEYDEAKSLAEDAQKQLKGIGSLGVDTPYLDQGQTPRFYSGYKASIPGSNEQVPLHVVYDKKGNAYFAVLTKTSDDKYTVDRGNIYTVNTNSGVGTKVEDTTILDEISGQYSYFIKKDAGSYQNSYKNPEVRYYETDPYKGMPAVTPIDLKEGWYAATKQTLPTFGNIKAFEDSGKVSSFWLCNVGTNGREEFNSGLGDDECEMFNVNTGQALNTFPGLSETKASELVKRSISALEKVASQYSPGVQRVNVPGVGSVKVGNPAANLPGTQCQDFMSPKDCQLMFNVCDPVICPSSRCNLGGKYYASDVIQTGIVGGIFMCLPNYKEGIVIPVCLTGIHAGVDNYVSILKASRDCLQENLNSGQYVGICDEITAIYTCEFFWKQISPAANVILPKLLEKATGKGMRGGGEYLSVQSAWSNMQNSIDYFKGSYGVNALNAFRVRSTQDIGSPVCKAFVSTKYPNKFKTLIEPDSPSQFSAWFTEIKQTDATVQGISQYKVYFHIFAGNDLGVQYSIYLKDSPGSSFFQPTGNVHVATGFIGRGEYVDEARDFTAPSNYQQLCVRINAQEKCGFKQVSTSFAVNYLRDSYIKNQLTDQVTTEKACVSGEPDPLALANPNIQAGVEEAITPQIYNSGIIRVCATSNPGLTTSPERWQRLGYCGDVKVGCWLDRESIGKAITPENAGARNKTISELDAIRESLESEGKKFIDDFTIAPIFLDLEKKISDLEWKAFSYSGEEEVNFDSDAETVNNLIKDIENKYVLTSDQEGMLLYYRSKFYGAVAENDWVNKKKIESKEREETPSTPTTGTTAQSCVGLGGAWTTGSLCKDSEDDITINVISSEVNSHDVTDRCCKAKSSTTSPSSLNDKIQFACDYFGSQGYSEVQTSGIIGNLIHESRFDTTILGDSGSAYGIAQWRFERRTNLENFAKAKSPPKDVSDFQTQLEFVNHELKGSGGNGGGSKRNAYGALIKTISINSATRVFMDLYEIPGIESLQSRINNANKVNNLCFNSGLVA
ncbi:MAG: phage tail tip lysozyme [Nanoarchaeota archaeon]